MGVWMGADLGGRRKRFDVALIDDRRVIDARRRQSVDDLIACVLSAKPAVLAVDSPRSGAPPGMTHRPEEKKLRDALCGIRWTPPSAQLKGNPYYEWIVEGLRLYEALQEHEVEVIECFRRRRGRAGMGPATAAGGPRGRATRLQRQGCRTSRCGRVKTCVMR